MKKLKIESNIGKLIIIGIITIGILSSGCTTNTKPEPKTQVEIKVMGLWSGDEEANFKKVLETFENKTGIKTKYISQTTEGMMVGMPTAFSTENTPADVILAPWPARIKDFSEGDHLVDISGIVDKNEYSDALLAPVTVGSNIYAVPFKMAAKPGYWYKKSFFKSNGLKEPSTYPEFKNLLANLKGIKGIEAPIASGNGVGWPISDTTENFIIGMGGPTMHQGLMNGTLGWTSPEVKIVFNDLAELLKAGYFSTPADWTVQVKKFWDEKYGIYFMGDWIAGMSKQGVDPADLDFFPFPETKGTVVGIDYAFIPKYTKSPDEAKELVKFLGTAEAQEIWVKQGGFLGPNLNVKRNLYTPIAQKELDFLANVVILPGLGDSIGGEFQTTLWDQLKLLWVSPTSLDQVLEAIQEKAPGTNQTSKNS